MAAITLQDLTKKLERLGDDMKAGALKHGEYDQRLARIIQEARDRKLAADRPAITTALNDLLARGVITGSVKAHLENRLGLV